MKITKFTILLFPLLTFMPKIAAAQEMRTMSFDASTSLMLQEFQAMLILDGDEVKVELRMGRDEAKSGIDRLEQGDVILMMNGKRIKDIEGLRTLYESVEKDAEIKIGVRRGNERFILNAIKGDVPEGGGMRMVMSMDTDVDGPSPTIVSEMGALLVDRDGSVVVERVIPPLLPDELKAADIEGYSIKKLNGKSTENAEEVRTTLEALEIGAEISITFEKDGDEITVVYTKKETQGSFSISRDNN